MQPSDVPLTAAESLAIDEATERLTAHAMLPLDAPLVVIGSDVSAAAAAAALAPSEVRVFHDLIPVTTPAPAVPGVTAHRHELAAELFADARLVLAMLPKSLAELDEIATLAARYGRSDLWFCGAARDKDMTVAMNEVLARHFATVEASRGRRKARALIARGPRTDADLPVYPRRAVISELGFDVLAHGGAFAGAKLDIGTRALLATLAAGLERAGIASDAAVTALDLGSGTGVLATALARRLPNAQVLASDRSWAAVASTTATALDAEVDVTVTHEDAAASVPDASVDLVLLNPPFHDGHAVIDDMADHLFGAAARVLRPGGALLTVYNSHLRHRAALERLVGPTDQLDRTPKFTVTFTRRR